MEQQSPAPTVSAISLDGPAVRLRPLTRADYPFLWRCRTHPDILYLWMHARTLPSFELYAQELDGFLAREVLTMLLIETQSDTPMPVGYIFAYEFSAMDHTASVSIVVHPAYAVNGWAAEAAVMFFNYLFAYFDLNKVSLDVFAFNTLLLQPLTAVGARVEGRFIAQRYYQGRYHDVVRLAVLRQDWDTVGPQLLARVMARPEITAAAVTAEAAIVRDSAERAGDAPAAETVTPRARRKGKPVTAANGAHPDVSSH